MNKKQN